MHINKIQIPKFGVLFKMPEISITDLEKYLRYIQSTKKNIKVDKNACVMQNKIPLIILFVSPQQKTKYIIFIAGNLDLIFIFLNNTFFTYNHSISIFKKFKFII